MIQRRFHLRRDRVIRRVSARPLPDGRRDRRRDIDRRLPHRRDLHVLLP